MNINNIAIIDHTRINIYFIANQILVFFEINILIVHNIVISNHIAATRVPVVVDIKSGALAILSIPVIQTIIIHSHIDTIISTRRATITSPNRAISINAVCFDILANAKKHHDIIIYLSD